MTESACAVIVTFHPPIGLASRVARLIAEGMHTIVVDNGSFPTELASLRVSMREIGAQLIENRENLGIASALNIGLRQALADGYSWVLTLDQDSEPTENMTLRLRRTASEILDSSDVAIIAPSIKQLGFPDRAPHWLVPSRKIPALFRRASCTGSLMDVSVVITSGSLTNLTVWDDLGGFADELFIDYVDTEYCLRALRARKRIMVDCRATMWHSLGARKSVSLLGRTFFPTNHSADRHYYIARNRVHVQRRHGLAVPHWLLFDIVSASYGTVRVLLTERQRAKKLSAMVRGTVDGVLGRYGPKRPTSSEQIELEPQLHSSKCEDEGIWP